MPGRILLPLFLFFAKLVVAQNNQFVDSIRASFTKEASFTCDYGGSNSFINNRKAYFSQYSVGVDFGRDFTVSGTYNTLSSTLGYSSTESNGDNVVTLFNKTKVDYIGYSLEYTFYRTKHWKFAIPVQLGWGFYHVQKLYPDKKVWTNREFIFVYEPTMRGRFKINNYMGFSANVGYKLFLVGNKFTRKMNSPIYTFSIHIAYTEIYKRIKSKYHKQLAPIPLP